VRGQAADEFSLAAAIDEDKDTIESIYEPFLMRIGFLERTPRGRKLTEKAWRHLGFAPPGDGGPRPAAKAAPGQKKLF
jgi:Holliday junction DNA helicase RuvB